MSLKSRIYPSYFLVGALVLYLGLYVVPGLGGLYYSFTNWNAYSSKVHFVGFANLKQVFSLHANYLFYIRNTLEFAFVSTIAKTVIALACALLLQRGLFAKDVYRSILFAPAVLSFLITGLVFRSILHPTTGLLDSFLNSVGLHSLAVAWLVDPKVAFLSIMGVDAWRGVGYLMVIFLAGLQAIPSSYYDAAEIDGARYFQRLRHVTIPLLMPAMAVVVVLNVVYGFRVFDIIYVLTNGGPGHLTDVVNTVVFEQFSEGNYALATTLSTLLFVAMAVVGYVLIRIMNRRMVAL